MQNKKRRGVRKCISAHHSDGRGRVLGMGCSFARLLKNAEIHPGEYVNNNQEKSKQVALDREALILKASEKHTERPQSNTASKHRSEEDNTITQGPVMAESSGAVKGSLKAKDSNAPSVTKEKDEGDKGQKGVRSESVTKQERSASEHLVPCPLVKGDLGEGYESVHELYNSINDGHRMPFIQCDPTYMLILDVRDREAFNEQHITTARHSSAVDSEFDCLLSQGKLEKFTMIVVYDQSSTAEHVDPNLVSFVQRLEEARISVSTLSGGFQLFQETYPFLCNNLTIRSDLDRMRLFKSYPSVVIEGALYQGNVQHSVNKDVLTDLKITHILNVTSECKNMFPEAFTYLHVEVMDETSAQLLPRLRSAVEFIDNAIANGGRVMVHCVQGKSRSSTCTIAYLMSSRCWTLKDAHDFLKECRSVAAPNRGFLQQLSKFEQSLFGTVLSSVDDLYF